MALDKGKQFEYAIMRAAYSKLPSPLEGIVKATYDAIMRNTNNGVLISADVDKAAHERLESIEPFTNKEQFYSSFRQLGGGAGGGGEPKTDVLFIKNGEKYKCSMKWGASYQLSSAGVQKTSTVLNLILAQCKSQSMSTIPIEEIALFLYELENSLGVLPKKGEQAAMKRSLEQNLHLKYKFEQILGSRKSPIVADSYKLFKDLVVRESLTGELLFGKTNDKAANYILNEKELKPIDDKLVREISDLTYVRLRLKGRGKTSTGIRLNELVVTIEPK